MTPESSDLVAVELTVFTDSLVIRGRATVPVRPLAQTLAALQDGILELDDVTLEEHGSRGQAITAPVAQVRGEAIVLALSDPPLDAEEAGEAPSVLLAVPPFNVAGRLTALSADDGIRDALRGLPRTGFLAVTRAAYWSEPLGEGRRRAAVAAVNAARIQLALPYREVDPWAGLDQPRGTVPGVVMDVGLARDQGMTAGDEV